MAQHITVRVGRLPGKIAEFALNGDRTVATALATAALDATGYEIRVQGAPALPTTILAEGDLVLLVKKIKGNADGFMVVRVGRVPGPSLVEVAIETATVAAALAAAGIVPSSAENVFVNDQVGVTWSPVADGDRVVVKQAPKASFAPAPIVEDDGDDDEVGTSFDLAHLGERLQALREEGAVYRVQADQADARVARIEAALAKYGEVMAEIDALLETE